MKISAIIPTYNSEKTLEDAILSVSNSAYPLLEIIIIDDGSNTQDAKFIVESLNKKINISIIYIRQDNLGPSSARNRGINIARGDWIAFLDSDDLMLVDCIQSKLDHFYCCNDKPNIGAIYGSFIWSSTNQTQMFQKSYLPVSRNHVGIMGKVPGGAPAYIFKKDALLNINGFDESLTFNEDFDILLRLIKDGYKIVGTDKPGFIRTVSENSLTRASTIRSLRGSRIFLKKAYKEKLLSNFEIFKRLIINYLISIKHHYLSITKQ